jgi:hypothetical protein
MLKAELDGFHPDRTQARCCLEPQSILDQLRQRGEQCELLSSVLPQSSVAT